MKTDESFGIVPLRRRGDAWQVYLVKHIRGHFWGFPKGHAQGDEKALDAALREMKEETSLELVTLLSEKPIIEKYQFLHNQERVYKTVLYFAAEVMGEAKIQEEEVEDAGWFHLEKAMKKLTFPQGKTVLSQVIDELALFKEK
jgi:bis(5'-nucleosidyl)-tetraphosphatase